MGRRGRGDDPDASFGAGNKGLRRSPAQNPNECLALSRSTFKLPFRSFKGRVQKTRPCSFTARGLRGVAPKREFPATDADVSVHRRSRLALSGSPRLPATLSEAT